MKSDAEKSLRKGGSSSYIGGRVRPSHRTFAGRWRTTHIMSTTLDLEFVLVSSDYATMNAVSGGVKKYGAKFILVPTAETALDCLNRRKIDGVFIDLAVPGGLELIAAIRKGASNCKAVIFACIASARESTATLNAGGNFLLRKPLSVDSVALHITIAKELLLHEQRRYFRHTVNLGVVLKEGQTEIYGMPEVSPLLVQQQLF